MKDYHVLWVHHASGSDVGVDAGGGQVQAFISRWREIRACNDNACGESKGQNYHDSLLDSHS
jgi:hypothetical protein